MLKSRCQPRLQLVQPSAAEESIWFQTHSCDHWRDLAPHGLLAGGSPGYVDLLKAAHGMAACFITESQGSHKSEKDGITIFYNLISEVTPHLFAEFCLSEASRWVQLILKGRALYMSMKAKRQISWDHFRGFFPLGPFVTVASLP